MKAFKFIMMIIGACVLLTAFFTAPHIIACAVFCGLFCKAMKKLGC